MYFTKRKILAFVLPIFIVLAAVFVIPGFAGREQTSPAKPPRRVFDEHRFPLVDFVTPEPADSTERAKRRLRGRRYDNSSWAINPEALSDSTVRVDFVDRNLPAFPVKQAQAVVIGTVSEARAHLSNDKTGVYSVFAIVLDEVLQNSSKVSLMPGNLIEAEREGGRVKFPSGKVHLYMIAEQNMPQVGGRYILFLTGRNDDPLFEILTGYELREGVIYPLDDLPNLRVYEKATETGFLNILRTKIGLP